MKNFRGRLIRVDANDYVVADTDSDSDSEVAPVYEEDENLQLIFAPGVGLPFNALGLGFYSDSESSEDEEGEVDDSNDDDDLSASIQDSNNSDSSSSGTSDGGVYHDELFIPITQARRRSSVSSSSLVNLTTTTNNQNEGEAEDVSLEGYFAFGGERRRISTLGGGIASGLSVSTSTSTSTTTSSSSPRSSSSTCSAVSDSSILSLQQQPQSQPRASRLSLSPAAIESLNLGEVGLEQILVRAIAMNDAENQTASTTSISTTPPSLIKESNGEEKHQLDKRHSDEEKEHELRPSAKKTRLCAEEKEEEDDDKNVNLTPSSDDRPASESGESGRTIEEMDPEIDLDVTCNPMVSDVEELEENDDALRGDRIGNTTYSERHVLKILMKWVQDLPKYSEEGVKEEEIVPITDEENLEPPVDKTRFLEKHFEEEMALLWDMSFEPDVMNFLVQHNAFNIIRETINVSFCDRLTEIGLGIMANIISQQSIVEDFSIHDASLKLVEGVVLLAQKIPRVPVLIQVFSVMRRITWFLKNVALVQTWKELLLSHDFLTCANFILTSSTNALLIGNVIVSLFSILEALSPDLTEVDKEDEEEEEEREEEIVSPTKKRTRTGSASCFFFGKALEEKKKDFENYRSFCETQFVVSLCEGLNELLKNPKPRKVQKMTSTHTYEKNRSLGDDATEERNLDDLEQPIPEGHIQTAVLNGLSSLVYLHKTPNGKQAIRDNHNSVFGSLLNLLKKFALITTPDHSSNTIVDRSNTLDYFALGLNLLAFCHKQQDCLSQEGLKVPLVIAAQLMTDEDDDEDLRTLQQKDGIAHDSKTFIALVLHEYYASLSENFGLQGITKFKTEMTTVSDENRSSSNAKKYKQFFQVVDTLVAAQVVVSTTEEDQENESQQNVA